MERKGIKIAIIVLLIILILLIANLIVDLSGNEEKNELDNNDKITIITEDFNDGVLNTQTWQVTREGDFQESTIDVFDVDPTEEVDHRLRLRANTIGTADDTVKFHGVRSVQKFSFSKGLSISFNLDWNNQSNGCYLTGSIYLCPNATSGNPREEDNWLKFEYVGVPPGKNARGVIETRINGGKKLRYTEGWPENRTGRKIGNQHITIFLDNENLTLKENGKEIYTSSSHNLNFDECYIYLQMSSHSNYHTRDIYFDNVKVNT